MVSLVLPARRVRQASANPLRRMAAQLKEWQARARGRRLMLEFDARMFRDIGVCPAQIAYEVRKPFWRA